jgi:hypothetical protein
MVLGLAWCASNDAQAADALARPAEGPFFSLSTDEDTDTGSPVSKRLRFDSPQCEDDEGLLIDGSVSGKVPRALSYCTPWHQVSQAEGSPIFIGIDSSVGIDLSIPVFVRLCIRMQRHADADRHFYDVILKVNSDQRFACDVGRLQAELTWKQAEDTAAQLRLVTQVCREVICLCLQCAVHSHKTRCEPEY